MKKLINKKTGEVAIINLYNNTIYFSKSKTTHKAIIHKDPNTHKTTKITSSPDPIPTSTPKPIKKLTPNNIKIKSNKPINTPNIKSTSTPKIPKFISLPNNSPLNIILKSPIYPKTPLKTPTSTFKIPA